MAALTEIHPLSEHFFNKFITRYPFAKEAQLEMTDDALKLNNFYFIGHPLALIANPNSIEMTGFGQIQGSQVDIASPNVCIKGEESEPITFVSFGPCSIDAETLKIENVVFMLLDKSQLKISTPNLQMRNVIVITFNEKHDGKVVAHYHNEHDFEIACSLQEANKFLNQIHADKAEIRKMGIKPLFEHL